MSEYIEQLLAKGRCTFTLDEAQKTLGKSRAAIILSIEHLKQQQKVVSPAKGFYAIVPPEYRIYGCLPAEYFIPYLMDFWQESYYVCLVTAASYHGATHQQPQTFQVMVKQYRKSISCGKVKVDFIANKHIEICPTQSITTQRSKLIVATPETTAMDLLNYPRQCGGLNRIATMLDELREVMQEKRLLMLLEIASHHFWKQRLGYVLEKLGAEHLASIILQHLHKLKRVDYIPLDISHSAKDYAKCTKNIQWKIIENADFESDI